MKSKLFWTCECCGFVTPRDKKTKKDEVGFCPKCDSITWVEGSADEADEIQS